MFKSMLVSLVVVLLFVLAYYVKLFDWLASKGAFVTAIISVAVVLSAAVIILGNPLKRADDNDKDKQ